jgi:hypothetical protein
LKKRSRKAVLVWMTALCMTFSTIGVASAASVSDIKGHWAEDTITSWSQKNLVAGYEDGTFRPEVQVNRQEFVALANRSFGFVEPGIIQFTDVAQKDWSYSDISIAKQAGYISGYPDLTFKPKKELSRQEVAVIVANLLGLNASASASAELYADAKSAPEWSKAAIGAVTDHQIMRGYPDGTFRPLRSTTRAEAIVILDKALKVKAQWDSVGSVPTTPVPTTPVPTTPVPTTPVPTTPVPTTPVPTAPSQPSIATATLAPGSNFTISAPAQGVTAWLAPAGTTNFIAGANMTSLAGNGTATTIKAPATDGVYQLFLKNTVGTSLPSVGTLTVAVTSETKTVNLGLAGNYAILSKTGISTVPGSVITGNIGVSPIDSTAITGFGLQMDVTNTFSTSTQVTGAVYAAGYTNPTPDNLTTAISNLETAYTDATGRNVNYTELHAGDLSGKTLTTGVYKWGTDVLINSDVTLHGGADDIFIFQVSGKIIQSTNTNIILTGGAQAKNIFWLAADTVSIGTGAHFEGNILSMTNISLGTNASVNGRLLAQTAVTLDQNRVTAP